MNNKLKTISKFLNLILRHQPEKIGLELDSNGWADMNELMEKSKKVKLTQELIEEVVSRSHRSETVKEHSKTNLKKVGKKPTNF